MANACIPSGDGLEFGEDPADAMVRDDRQATGFFAFAG